jgi:hypothetical protein
LRHGGRRSIATRRHALKIGGRRHGNRPLFSLNSPQILLNNQKTGTWLGDNYEIACAFDRRFGNVRHGLRREVRDAEFIDHMHAHAEQLDNLNFALADNDLPGALTAAYWLSGHQEVSGIREEWRPYLNGMREEAKAIEEAKDIETARAAAERINEQCQGCHTAAGVNN